MNIYMTELNTTERKETHIDIDGPSSKYSEKDSDVYTGPAETVWASQHAVQPGAVDPLSLGFRCPCPFAQCQLTHPDYFLEPQWSQNHLLTGPVPGLPGSSHPSPVSAPWFNNEVIPCSMMPGDIRGPVASVCAPQPVVCNASGGEQVVLVNPCEPEAVFLTLESTPQHRDDGPAHRAGVRVFETPDQLPQYHQAAHPLCESRDETANIRPQAPAAQTVETVFESKSRKPCHCTRSQCLKLYCECFANGAMCSNCDCINCYNNVEHDMKRHNAIKSCLRRNPDAFRSKIAGGKSGEVKGWHRRGCKCRRSGCLKNYCECYEANIKCTSSCKCVGCGNYDGSDMGPEETTVNVRDMWPRSLITPAVVEGVCSCLLAQAKAAECDGQSTAQVEHIILEEFGYCLMQIVKARKVHTDTSELDEGDISGSSSSG